MQNTLLAAAVAALLGGLVPNGVAAQSAPISGDCSAYPAPPGCLKGPDPLPPPRTKVVKLKHLKLEAEVTRFAFDERRLEATVQLTLRNKVARYQALWFLHDGNAFGDHVALTAPGGDVAPLVAEHSRVKLCRAKHWSCSKDFVLLQPEAETAVTLVFDAAALGTTEVFDFYAPIQAAVLTDKEASGASINVRRKKALPGELRFPRLAAGGL